MREEFGDYPCNEGRGRDRDDSKSKVGLRDVIHKVDSWPKCLK